MLTKSEIDLIKGTVPILKEHGLLLTKHFYQRMFRLNPELKNVFNMGNQKNETQQTSLANSVLAYAENIENPGVLLPVLKHIGEKHTSLLITAEQYAIVGENLLASIKEVLGDGASDELIAAWGKAYTILADIMINLEKSIYIEKGSSPGSWSGWRKFVIKKKVQESDEISSFYLYPEDGKDVAFHKPGQYLSIRVFVKELGLFQPRQYSISSAPGNKYYRISVKKEIGQGVAKEDGIISNYLHNTLGEGDIVEATPPAGEFVLNLESKGPVVLISGGIGQTPFMSMLKYLAGEAEKREVKWIHGCRSANVHAFKNEVSDLDKKFDWLEQIVFYDDCSSSDDNVKKGRVELSEVKETILLPGADYYICGPKLFLEKTIKDLAVLGVDSKHVFFEEFGPQTLNIN